MFLASGFSSVPPKTRLKKMQDMHASTLNSNNCEVGRCSAEVGSSQTEGEGSLLRPTSRISRGGPFHPSWHLFRERESGIGHGLGMVLGSVDLNLNSPLEPTRMPILRILGADYQLTDEANNQPRAQWKKSETAWSKRSPVAQCHAVMNAGMRPRPTSKSSVRRVGVSATSSLNNWLNLQSTS